MESCIRGISIEAVSAAVPDRWLSLADQFGNTSDANRKIIKKFTKNTGVEGRFVSTYNQVNSDWCYAAAKKIIEDKKIDKNSIGVIVYVTQTSDYRKPSTATVLQYRLGIGEDCIAFDVNLGCSGYVCGLNIVGSIMMESKAQYGLLMCGETASRDKIPTDSIEFNTGKLLFGDAGSATLLKKDIMAKNINFMYKTDGSRYNALIAPWGFYRNPYKSADIDITDDIAVFNFSTNEVPVLINELMGKMGCTAEDYDYLVLHQSNKLIMSQIEKKTGFSSDKSIKAIDKFANTSSASIPVSLVEKLALVNNGVSHFMLCGYGIGLSWCAVDCYMNVDNVYPLIKTDEYYEDDY
ncbi:MAG: hypothetical protein IJ232_01095 [Lachnospiraceae bacterium]|nr:hypothetical protein [Lachnospiraceae bacterium]